MLLVDISLRARNTCRMTEKDVSEAWGSWLSQQLSDRGWRQADLVRESQGLIKRDRVSKWVNGIERPTYRLTVVVANTLTLPTNEVLQAAGYATPEQDPLTEFEAHYFASNDVTDTAAIDPRALREYPDSMLMEELARRLAARAGHNQSQAPESIHQVSAVAAPRDNAMTVDDAVHNMAEELRREIDTVFRSAEAFETAAKQMGHEIDLSTLEEQLTAHIADDAAPFSESPMAIILDVLGSVTGARTVERH